MKKITFLVTFLVISFGYSQTVLEDFETTLAAGSLAGDSGMATTPEVVADPATGGTNGDVLKIVTSADGDGWQNAQLFFQGADLDLTTSNKIVTVDIYSTSAFNMLAKTASPLNGVAESATDASHSGSGWETLSFDFSDPKDNTATANDVFGRILFFPQWNGGGWNDSSVTTTYVDNITGLAAAASTCANGVLDGDETGVDCGGSCSPCATGTPEILEDFETTLAAGSLAGDSGMATTPEVVADPATGGTNGDVLKIVTSADGDGWQNAQLFFQGADLDLTTSNKIVTVDIYSTSAFNMLAKTASPLNGVAESATDASHSGSGWETLSFDFSDPKDNTATANDVFGRILFFPQWNGGGWNDSSVTTTYVDNITGLAAATEGPSDNDYCEKVVTHLGIASGQEASEIKLTVVNSGEKTMKITIESNNEDAVDLMSIPGDVTGSPTQSAADESVAGKMTITLTWPETAPTDVALNILWSKVSTDGNWQLGDAPTTFKFAATCATASVSDNTLLNISMYPNPALNRLNISAPNTIKSAVIYNILGKQVMSLNINKNIESIDVSNLSTGMYLIKYTIGNAVGTAKFIKQ
ncbi:T9SS type A sorting domain-containing protein [Polaribacter sp.]|uniref:T9SS type A sorting domain-containing protein n=1 Tax=Polaribacter sp. TaxID=1920175 RepID=UPI003F4BDC50